MSFRSDFVFYAEFFEALCDQITYWHNRAYNIHQRDPEILEKGGASRGTPLQISVNAKEERFRALSPLKFKINDVFYHERCMVERECLSVSKRLRNASENSVLSTRIASHAVPRGGQYDSP